MQTTDARYSLFHDLDAFWPLLPASLVHESRLAPLKESARLFPQVLRIGIECRMDGEAQVDLQQCLLRDKDDLAYISDWLHSLQVMDDEEWTALCSFFRKWADPSGAYYRGIREIFLEMDVLSGKRSVPLLFFSLDQEDPHTTNSFLVKVLQETLGGHRAFYPLLQRCFASCPDNASVFFAGIQFSRQTDAIRVNIRNLYPGQVIPFLRSLGYDYETEGLERWIPFVYGLCDRVRVCIDLGKAVYPKVGFECLWDDQPGQDTRWEFFLHELTGQGICLREKAEAVLSWDGELFPDASVSWPEHIWLRSLSRPPDELACLKKKVSHLKLSVDRLKNPELKAYLGYGNVWLKAAPEAGGNALPAPVKETAGTTAALMDTAAGKACRFILDKQLQSGFWTDFFLPAGKSDEWVTAYTGYHLSFLQAPETDKALSRAWEVLKLRCRAGKGWGYNVRTPADADSTVWAHLFSGRLPGSDAVCAQTGALLAQYILPSGAVTTYPEKDGIREYTRLPAGASFEGWQHAHVCVTAPYALAGETQAIVYLAGAQGQDGSFRSYWWTSDAYATAIAVEALAMQAGSSSGAIIGKAVRWALDRLGSSLDSQAPSAFDIAMLVRILLLSPDKEITAGAIRRGIGHLVNTQLDDGSWRASAGLRVPMPDTIKPEESGNNWVINDQNRIFTTITVLAALIKSQQQ